MDDSEEGGAGEAGPHTAWVSAQDLLIFHLESTWYEPRLNRNLFNYHRLQSPVYFPGVLP